MPQGHPRLAQKANKTQMNMGVAIRMATLMMLHREETYKLNNPTPEAIMVAESARRTIWMLHSQDNLHSGPVSPVALSAFDITTLLPCDEDDFANGGLASFSCCTSRNSAGQGSSCSHI